MYKLGFHSMIAAIVYSCCTAVMAGSLTPPVGPPTSTMRTLDEVETAIIIKRLPFTISAPGTYKVVGNLSTTTSGITIEASDVTLDLNGSSISGIAGGAVAGIVVAATSKNVTIKNGSCTGFNQAGIRSRCPSNLQLENLLISKCGESGIDMLGGTLSRCIVSGSSGTGIVASSSSASPFRCISSVCRDNGSDGLSLTFSPSGTCPVDIESCKFTGNGTTGSGSGIKAIVSEVTSVVTWSSSQVVCSSNSTHGTSLQLPSIGSVCYDLKNCVNSSNGGNGFSVTAGGGGQGGGSINGPLDISVSKMTCSSNGGDGFRFLTAPGSAGSSSVSIADSAFCFNKGGGINHVDNWIKASFDKDKGRCSDNSTVGCFVKSGQVDCNDCDFSRNGGHGAQISSKSARCKELACIDNGGSGIRFDGHVTVLKARGSLSDSTCSSNALDGIDLNGVPFHLTCSSTSAGGNGACGVRVRGWDSTTKGSIGIDNDCDFSDNGENGIQVDACNSSVVCSSVRCTNNSGSGFFRKGWDGTVKGGSKFVDCDFSFNAASGALIEGGGVDQDCDGIVCSNNGGSGMSVGKSPNSQARGTVTIVKSCFNSNQTGLDLACLSGATITSCQADKNTSSGMVLSGSGMCVSENRACKNTLSGISLVSGTHGEICNNVTISNRTGILVAATGNSISNNTSSDCPSPISAPADSDLAPSSPASTATSPFTNVTF